MTSSVTAVHLRSLQSVLNAAARLVFNWRRHDYYRRTALLAWSTLTGGADSFKDGGASYRALQDTTPLYLMCFCSIDGRRGLQSADTAQLLNPRIRCVTFGARAFPVVDADIGTIGHRTSPTPPQASVFSVSAFNLSFLTFAVLIQLSNWPLSFISCLMSLNYLLL